MRAPLAVHAVLVAALFAGAAAPTVWAAAGRPSVEQALNLKPVQRDAIYDAPDAAAAAQCTLEAGKDDAGSGWLVYDAGGRLLRRFLDTNGDNKVDLWCYYQEGIETYRDIDANFNGKADQYRWLGHAGMRWGDDPDEDGRIDAWKTLSAEEASAELVAAIRDQDAARFRLLLPTAAELRQLGLGAQRTEEWAARVAAAQEQFPAAVRKQQVVGAKTQWLQFGAVRPSVAPAGTNGLERDLVLYDNAAAIVETDGSNGQVQVGTLVRLGEVWRLTGLPPALADEQNTSFPGVLASFTPAPRTDVPAAAAAGVTPEMQTLLAQLDQAEKALAAPGGDAKPALHQTRADLLEKLIAAAAPADRGNWVRQFADTVGAAAQAGTYPEGAARLRALAGKLAARPEDEPLLAYVAFRRLTAEYTRSLQAADADYAKIQEQWIADLTAHVDAHPRAEDSAEAMLQLALAHEFAGQDEDAVKWYGRIAADFPEAPLAAKATGARRRLECVGQAIEVRGRGLDGSAAALSSLTGKVVLVHYWAVWCEPCKQEFARLKELHAKYGAKGFALLGVNLDADQATAQTYLRSSPLPWPQLYEAGGLDSRLANEMGVLTLPTMLLVDKNGKVVSRNVHVGDLEAELTKLLR